MADHGDWLQLDREEIMDTPQIWIFIQQTQLSKLCDFNEFEMLRFTVESKSQAICFEIDVYRITYRIARVERDV